MFHWALVVAGLYGLLLLALILPLHALGWADQASEAARMLLDWELWAFVGILVAAQLALLVVPVKVAGGRPVGRRTLALPVAVSGALAGLLAVGALLAIDEAVRGAEADVGAWAPPLLAAGTWVAWAAVFWRMSHAAGPRELVTRQARALLAGSILELLVAVPSHVIARSRDYCCAGIMTFLGLVFGLAVMLASFGPGVFFLYADRIARLRRTAAPGS